MRIFIRKIKIFKKNVIIVIYNRKKKIKIDKKKMIQRINNNYLIGNFLKNNFTVIKIKIIE